jgi:hypothetical protein
MKNVSTRPGSKPEVSALPAQVFSTLKNGHHQAVLACPFRAKGDIARLLEMKEAAEATRKCGGCAKAKQ